MLPSIRSLLFACIMACCCVDVCATCESCPKEVSNKLFDALKRPGNSGKDFWFTFLPCYATGGGNNYLMIYVASATRTRVRVEIEAKGYAQEQTVVANGIVAFKMDPGMGQAFDKDPVLQAPVEQVYKAVGIHITASAPIVVYGVTRFYATSDSFLALPVQVLGKEYIVSSMPDMSKMYPGYSLPSEVAVVGVYPGTVVTFTCGGPGVTQSVGGLVPGQTTSFTLGVGDVWIIANNAASKEGDFSGSIISSSKPVGVLSGNQCSNVPTTIRWCDFICEMELPTSLWGNHYLIPKNSNRKYGYYMKVQSSKPNNHISYDGSFWKLIRTAGGQEGTGWIYQRVNTEGNIVAHLDSECPIAVTVFNPGTEDDNIDFSDPFQMNVLAVEQFQRFAHFCTPGFAGGNGFKTNYLGIVFQLDSASGTIPQDLEFGIEQNGKIYWRGLSLVFGPAIGPKNIYIAPVFGKRYAFKEVLLGSGSMYYLRCSTPFAAYVYGGDGYDSFGHPATAAMVSQGGVAGCDSVAAIPKYTVECDGSVGVKSAATITDMPNSDSSRSNLSTIMLDVDSSFNYTLTYKDFIPGETRQTTWQLTVDDLEQDAVARVIFTDRAGNDTAIVVRYFATKLAVGHDLTFGVVKKNDVDTLHTDLTNNTQRRLTITKLYFKSSQTLKSSIADFEIIQPHLPFSLDPGEVIQIVVRYAATGADDVRDSIGIATDCFNKVKILVSARNETPVIVVSDIDFDPQVINTSSAPKTFRVSNTSRVQLRVHGVGPLTPDDGVFDIGDVGSANISLSSPLLLQESGSPTSSRDFQVRFRPTAMQSYSATLTFFSDATTVDSVCILRGTGIGPGLHVNRVEFGRRRIKNGPYTRDALEQTAEIVLRNSGSADVTVKRAVVVPVSSHPEAFTQVSAVALDLSVFDNQLISAGSELRRSIAYTPLGTGYDSLLLYFECNAPDSVVFVATGIGVVPRVTTADLAFGNYDLIHDTQEIQRPFRITNLDFSTSPAWEFYDTLHIRDLVDESVTGSSDISGVARSYSTIGFAYDKSAMLLPRIIAPGATVATVGAYKPTVASTATVARLTTVSDAEQEVVSTWTGTASGEKLRFTCENTNVSLCNGSTQRVLVKVHNTSTSNLSIAAPMRVRTTASSVAVLHVISLPQGSIPAGDSAVIELEAQALAVGDTTLQCIVEAHADSSSEIIIDTANVLVHVFEHRTRMSVQNVNGQYLSSVPQYFDVPIVFHGNLDNTGVNALDFHVRFDSRVLFPKRADPNMNEIIVNVNNQGLCAGCAASAQYLQLSADRGDIHVQLRSAQALSGGEAQVVLSIPFQLVLAERSVTTTGNGVAVELHDVRTFSDSLMLRPNSCAVIETDDGSVNGYWLCAQDIRQITVGNTTTAIIAVQPNPIVSHSATLVVGIGLSTDVTIEVINSLGQVVHTPVNGFLKSGVYSIPLTIPECDLGSFQLRLRCGADVKCTTVVVLR